MFVRNKIACIALAILAQMALVAPATAYERGLGDFVAGMAHGLTGLATALSQFTLPANAIAPAAGVASAPMPAAIARPTQPVPTPLSHGAFNSVAIPVGHISMTAQWTELTATHSAAFFTAACETRFATACETGFGQKMAATYTAAHAASPLAAIALVNRQVNAAITYQSDADNWGVGDYWATPAEIASNGRGDCEDYATTKMWLLLALGFSPDQLQLVILKDTRRNLYHAVLAVHLNGQRYILDNLSNTVRLDRQIGNYMPLVSFVNERTFIHGFDSRRTATASLPSDLTSVQPG